MANNENLIPNSERSPNEVRENGKKGGIASGKARRRKKLLRECLEELLEKEIKDKRGNTMTGAEAMAVKVFQQALKGDLKAFEIVRDTSGQKPVEKVMVADVEAAVIEEVEDMVKQDIDGEAGEDE